jgi:hypothetical protein
MVEGSPWLLATIMLLKSSGMLLSLLQLPCVLPGGRPSSKPTKLLKQGAQGLKLVGKPAHKQSQEGVKEDPLPPSRELLQMTRE